MAGDRGDDAGRQPGEVLEGRYRLLERLGQGGFGDVWRAEELLPDGAPLRQVALKLLHASVPVTDWAEEARIIASLRHPALVTIYAAGLLDVPGPQGTVRAPFVAMELLIGDDLARFVDGGARVPWRRALAWARATAAALDVIHQAGVVHLDLKPANLFLPEDGTLKVLDFGIARQGRGRATSAVPDAPLDELSTAAFMLAHEDPPGVDDPTVRAPTTERMVVGTPGFMAPEVFEDAEPSAAADAYALAAVVVQLTTGALPQVLTSPRPNPDDGTTVQQWFAEVQSATVRGHIRPLRAEHPELPKGVAELLQRWLALDPQARGVEPGNMTAQLDGVLALPHGPAEAPYPGLESFAFRDEGRLAGREEEIARIVRELEHQPCVVLHGQGGVGLRSIALAGVAPALARRFPDGRHDWRGALVRVDGDAPGRALRRALETIAPLPNDHEEEEPGADGEPPNPIALIEAHLAGGEDRGLVLVLDGFEALLGIDDAGVAEGLGALIEGREGLRVLVLLDADHTAALLDDAALGPMVRPWLRFLDGPPATEAEAIVTEPLQQRGASTTGLEAVIADVRAELSASGRRLPAVAIALARWWDAGGDAAAWRDGGGVVGFLASHGDERLQGLDNAERSLAHSVLLRLVAVDGTPVSVERGALLAPFDEEADAAAAIVDELIAWRIVCLQDDVVALLHPGLTAGWRTLDDLRMRDIDRLSFVEELRDDARRWAHAGESEAHTWPKARLAQLDQWGDALRRETGDEERAFIRASRRAVRRQRTVRALLGVMAAAALVTWVYLSGVAERREQAQRQAIETAKQRAATASLVTHARREKDPYVRLALLSAAIRRGSDDPLLPLEVFSTARGLPRGEFLTLEPIGRPAFPWGERWILGHDKTHAALVDFDPLGAGSGKDFGIYTSRFRPHDAGTLDVVALPYDHAFVTRGLDGEVKVWRVSEESGKVGLAAIAPMRCGRGLSQILVARRAPVIACSTAKGLARWVMGTKEVSRDAFAGRALDISPDGRWLLASRLDKVILWDSAAKKRMALPVERAPNVARFSPRDAAVALVTGPRIDVWGYGGTEATKLHETISFVEDPVAARWHARGVDLAVCDYAGAGEWHYLRPGPRDRGDGPRPRGKYPCEERHTRWPERLHRAQDYGPLLDHRHTQVRDLPGGWRRADGALITHDLVRIDLADRRLRRMLEVSPPQAPPAPGESVVTVARDGDRLAWQVGERIVVREASGAEQWSGPGRLLARCPDGGLLAWRRDAKAWTFFTPRTRRDRATLARKPGFVVGATPGCERVAVQWHDGRIETVTLTPGSKPAPSPGPAPAGYVYDARPSRHDGGSLWLADSSGALTRLVGRDGKRVDYGRATPRPTAMSDGPGAGGLVFADDTGVVWRRPGEPDRLVLAPRHNREWTDLHVLPGGRRALLAWSHGVALVDLTRAELLDEIQSTQGQRADGPWGRMLPYDDGGSVLLWSHAFMGPAQGQILPMNPARAGAVATLATNLRARIDEHGRPRLEMGK